MSAVFFAWAEHVSETLEHRRSLLPRSMGRVQNRPLSDAFCAWVAAVQEAKAARENLLAHAARHFVNHVAALAFDAWRDYLLWKQRLRRRTLLHASLLGCAVVHAFTPAPSALRPLHQRRVLLSATAETTEAKPAPKLPNLSPDALVVASPDEATWQLEKKEFASEWEGAGGV